MAIKPSSQDSNYKVQVNHFLTLYLSKLNIGAHQRAVFTLWFLLQAESNEYSARLAEQSERLQKAEQQSEARGQQVEELQRLLEGMKIESGILKDKMAAREAELLQLTANGEEGVENEQR